MAGTSPCFAAGVLLVGVLARLPGAAALDNGLRLPPMGWSSWYG